MNGHAPAAQETWNDITMAVLSGGRSRRFGSPKQLHDWNGCTLLERALLLASSLSDRVMIIGGSAYTGNHAPVPVYDDIYAGNGPLGGIHTALVRSRSPWVATLPCDMPMMNAAVYRLLAARRHADAPVVAITETALEPLICIWPKSSEPFLGERLKKGLSGPIPVLDLLGARRIAVHRECPSYDPAWFTNINTRSQLP
ncbi:molybdenum cofactor guanylyltransferase [bacterium]|nr:molybdenum cofactor guanylyltransferase [bacterium]